MTTRLTPHFAAPLLAAAAAAPGPDAGAAPRVPGLEERSSTRGPAVDLTEGREATNHA
ncbi:MAG: hypothetical protein H6828_02145 [Planctomycetes bacterium]|nr:hypothetical protein [Planctomycetota bacterium]